MDRSEKKVFAPDRHPRVWNEIRKDLKSGVIIFKTRVAKVNKKHATRLLRCFILF